MCHILCDDKSMNMDGNFIFHLQNMLFPFPLVAQNYSHSHGNPMGMEIPIPMHTSTVHEPMSD